MYYYCRRWQLTGRWQRLPEAVVPADRLAAHRPATPWLICLASQRMRLAPRLFGHRGLAGGKRVNGRKRPLLPEVQGRSLACRGHAATGHDGVLARALLPVRPPGWGPRLVTGGTDKAYPGRFARHLARRGRSHNAYLYGVITAPSYSMG